MAVLDTGINPSHNEFAGRIAASYNALTGATGSAPDGHGHGTHVAGIIAANRDGVGMHGIAYGAQLMPIKVMADDGTGNTGTLDQGLRWAADNGARIANMSLASTTQYSSSELQAAVSRGLLVVAAAGNRAQSQPDWPARFASAAWANGQIISVVAVDQSLQIASFSNRAGDARDFTLAAPGVGLTSTYSSGYASWSGTSMAAPVVAGAAALVQSRWPYLAARDVANVLFTTARDLGTPGTDDVYGRGLVDVDRAMQPVGTVMTPTASGGSVALTGSATGGAVGPAIIRAGAAGLLKVSGFDALGRDFSVDLGKAVMPVAPMPAAEVHALFQALGAAGTGASEPREPRLQLVRGSAFAVAPVAHLGLLENSLGVTGQVRMSARWSFAPAFAVQPEKATAASLALRYTLDRSLVGVAIASMAEAQTHLGTFGSGALALGRSSTQAVAFFGQRRLGEHSELSLSVSFGHTPAQQGALLSTSATATQALKATFTTRDIFTDGDRLAVSIDQPMRAAGGSLTIRRMVGADENGQAVMSTDSVSLSGQGREWRVGFAYAMPAGRQTTLQLGALLRRDAGHVAGAPMQRAALARVIHRF